MKSVVYIAWWASAAALVFAQDTRNTSPQSLPAAIAPAAAGEVRIPETTSTEKFNRLLSNFVAMTTVGIAYAKTRDASIDEYARFCGEQFAPGWNGVTDFPGFARTMLAVFEMLRPDEDPPVEIMAETDSLLRCKVFQSHLRHFREGTLLGVGLDEYARWRHLAFERIAAHLGFTYNQQVEGDFLIVTLTKGVSVPTSLRVSAQPSSSSLPAAASDVPAARSADALLAFIFTELGDQLSAYGHLQLLDQVTRSVRAYYEQLPAELQTRETRAGHAFALAGVAVASGWMWSETVGDSRFGEPAAGAQLERAMKIVGDLEATGPMTPFMRLSAANVCFATAWQFFRQSRMNETRTALEQADRVLTPALADPEWGVWARDIMAQILSWRASAYFGGGRAAAVAALPLLERALSYAEEADRNVPSNRRGHRPSTIKVWYAERLIAAGEYEKARRMNAEARARLRELAEGDPFLAAARMGLASAARVAAIQARAEWDFDALQSANEEIDLHYTELLKHNPKHWSCQTMLARSLAYGGESRRMYEWLTGNFDAAKAATERALELWEVDWIPVGSRNPPRIGRVALASICAAQGNDEEALRNLRLAEAWRKRDLEFRPWLTDAERQSAWTTDQNALRGVQFQRLDWPAMRRSAEDVLQKIPDDRQAHADLMRAAFEMGDYATAGRELHALPAVEPQASAAPIQHRFNRLGNELTRIHVLARAGQVVEARAALSSAWPEVDAVFAAGPDYLFNQVQTARALSIRAEVEEDAVIRRDWLERAAGYLRPAAVAGRLTRYERDVLLAGIERQLAQAPVASVTRTPSL